MRLVADCCAVLGDCCASATNGSLPLGFSHLSGPAAVNHPIEKRELKWHGNRTGNALASVPFPSSCCAPYARETTTNASFDIHAAQDDSIISTTDATLPRRVGVDVIRSRRTNCSASVRLATRSRHSARQRQDARHGDVRLSGIRDCCRERRRSTSTHRGCPSPVPVGRAVGIGVRKSSAQKFSARFAAQSAPHLKCGHDPCGLHSRRTHYDPKGPQNAPKSTPRNPITTRHGRRPGAHRSRTRTRHAMGRA